MGWTSYLRIRSYSVGVGDCFLLTLSQKKRPFHMLIDCGAMKFCESYANLKRVIEDVNENVEPDGLDVVVLSHTDMDHVEGLCDPSLPTLKLHPKEIWVPLNCDPDFRGLITYKGMKPLIDCFDRIMNVGQSMLLFLEHQYWIRSKSNCLKRIEDSYPSSEIRYVHSLQLPRSFSHLGTSFRIEILNPPPPSQYLLQAVLDMMPREVLLEANLSQDEISLIEKRMRDFPAKMSEKAWIREYLNPDIHLEDETSAKEREYPLPDDKQLAAIEKAGKALAHGSRINISDAKRLCKYMEKLYKERFLNVSNIASAIRPVEYEANLNSIVLNIMWQGRSILLTGDLVDWRFINNRLGPIAFLKVPHHGGKGPYLGDLSTLRRLISHEPVRSAPLAMIPTCATFKTGQTCCYTRGNPPDPQDAWNQLKGVGFHLMNTSSTLTKTNLYTDVYLMPEPIPALYAKHWTSGGRVT